MPRRTRPNDLPDALAEELAADVELRDSYVRAGWRARSDQIIALRAARAVGRDACKKIRRGGVQILSTQGFLPGPLNPDDADALAHLGFQIDHSLSLVLNPDCTPLLLQAPSVNGWPPQAFGHMVVVKHDGDATDERFQYAPGLYFGYDPVAGAVVEYWEWVDAAQAFPDEFDLVDYQGLVNPTPPMAVNDRVARGIFPPFGPPAPVALNGGRVWDIELGPDGQEQLVGWLHVPGGTGGVQQWYVMNNAELAPSPGLLLPPGPDGKWKFRNGRPADPANPIGPVASQTMASPI